MDNLSLLFSFFGIDYTFTLLLLLLPYPIIALLVLNKYVPKKELIRKLVHTIIGALFILSTYVLSYSALVQYALVVLLATVFILLMSNHYKKILFVRTNLGVVLFPASFLLTTIVFGYQNIEVVRFGLWILVVSDSLAAVIGSRYGRRIAYFNKSILGSVIFFLSALALSVVFLKGIVLILFAAFTLTLVEFFSRRGIDNVTIPLCCALFVI